MISIERSSHSPQRPVHVLVERGVTVSNGRAVVSHKTESHHAICRFDISRSAQSSSSVGRASAAKVEGPGFKSRLGQNFSNEKDDMG